MTSSTSLVAVWYSSDSVSSRVRACTSSNNRVFSMAITAWSAKVFSRPICRSVNGRTSVRRMESRRWPRPHESEGRRVWCGGQFAEHGHCPWVLTSFGLHIGNMNRSPIEDGTSSYNLTRQGQRVIRRDRPSFGDKAEKDAVHLKDRRVISIAKASRARRDLREH